MRNEGASWLLQDVKFVRRGGIYPARGTPRRRKPGGYGIRPYDRRRCPRLAGKRGPCIIAKVCRGRCSHRPGNPAPPQTPHVGADSISARPALPRTPAGGPWPSLQTGANIAAARFAWNTKFSRRGGIYPARGTLPCRGARRDGGIPPYVRPGGRGNPIWPVVPGRRVGEGHAPPANPAPPRTGRIWNPPLRCTAGIAFTRLAAVFPRLRRAGVHARRTVDDSKPGTFPPPQTPHVGADSISARPALPRTPAGGPWPSPANRGKHCGRPVCLEHKICP